MDKVVREELSVENVDGLKCIIEIPLSEDCTMVKYGAEKVGEEYLVVISEDPYCAGVVHARTLYEELKKRYEA